VGARVDVKRCLLMLKANGPDVPILSTVVALLAAHIEREVAVVMADEVLGVAV
jgi:hypothetical protein